MERLFLDAKVLFSAAHKADARVSRLWRLDDVVLCSSHYALAEARANLSEANEERRLTQLAERMQFVEAILRALPRGVFLPEKDAPILIAAIEANADYLLTGDLRHFGAYFGKKIEGVMVLPPGQYLERKIRNN